MRKFLVTLLVLVLVGTAYAQWGIQTWKGDCPTWVYLWNRFACPSGGELLTSCVTSFDALYEFEEATGSNATDSSGNGNTLTQSGTIARASAGGIAGRGQYAVFDGINDVFSCTDATCPVFDYVDAYTIGGWFMETSGGLLSAVFDKFTGVTGYNALFNNVGGTARMEHTQGDGVDNQINVSVSGRMAANEWHFLLVRYNDGGAIMRGWNDGTQFVVNTVQGDSPGNAADFELGADGGAGFFTGRMDDIFAIGGTGGFTIDNLEACQIASCNVDRQLCTCDGADPTLYKACSTDVDCRIDGNTVALCDGGTCKGRNSAAEGTPGAEGCTLPACNAPCP